jgi:uncharacterized membrane protein
MIVFDDFLLLVQRVISLIGVLVILTGGLKSAFQYFRSIFSGVELLNPIRLELGYSILLGLEFMVGADIIGSITKPSYYDMGLLAALVVIRTFLSYFLKKELDQSTSNHS